MKFYTSPPSTNCRKVEAVLRHTGLEAERVLVDPIGKGDNRTPEFLAINPNGKVPALVDGDVKLWESNAIMGYLCTKAESDLWPRSNVRYEILRWMFWELAHFGPATSTVVFERIVKSMLGMGPADEAVVAEALQNFDRFAAVLNGHLEDKSFILGDRVTIGDFALGSHLSYAEPAGLDLSPYGAIRAWWDRLNEIEGWRSTAPSM